MVKMTYSGVINPRGEFEAMRPAYLAAIKMMRTCKPFGPDYAALLAITDAMNAAAAHFMPGDAQTFFGARPHG